MRTVEQLATPAILIDADAMEKNLRRMQSACDASGTELWPHIKTHKIVPILRRQLELGAIGATCAKLGEAETMLASGVKRIFIANSLSDIRHAKRLQNLKSKLEELLLAVTSEAQFEVLETILAEAGLTMPVLMAIDTGLGREGVRSAQQAAILGTKIRKSSRMKLVGLYTHEGQAYTVTSREEVCNLVDRVYETLCECANTVGGDLPLWPGCSVTAALIAKKNGVKAVRPGSYVFGDLFLSEVTKIMPFEDGALSVLVTVVDRPVPDLALIDAGSKVFSSDKTGDGISGRCYEFPSLAVTRLSEEHGFLRGEEVRDLQLGQRLRFQPAHVCPVINLASQVYLVRGKDILETWLVDARGRSD